MAEAEILEQHSRKLNVVIALLLRILLEDRDFTQKKRKGTGDLAVYLKAHGLEYEDIAGILGSSAASIRELVSRGGRKKR
jgi:hypothetical protein